MAEKIKLSYRTLFFGGVFWQKVLNIPCHDRKCAYRIMKLKRAMEKARKARQDEFNSFVAELGEKAGKRTADGSKLEPYLDQQVVPYQDPEKKVLYNEIFDAFCAKEAELNLDLLPLDTFAHLDFTPNEWEQLSEVARVSEDELEKESSATGPGAGIPQMLRN